MTTSPTPQAGTGHGDAIATVEALDALPVGSVVLDRHGDAITHDSPGIWIQSETASMGTARLVRYGPFRVLHDPSAVAAARAGESDGDEHHTMDELYEYRMLFNARAARGWLAAGVPVVKSWRHSDGEACFGGGWFIVTATLPTGQVSNHYSAEHWDLFDVPEVDLPPEYDGHTPQVAAQRLRDALAARAAGAGAEADRLREDFAAMASRLWFLDPGYMGMTSVAKIAEFDATLDALLAARGDAAVQGQAFTRERRDALADALFEAVYGEPRGIAPRGPVSLGWADAALAALGVTVEAGESRG